MVLPSDDAMSAVDAEEIEDNDEPTPFRPLISVLCAGGFGLVGAMVWALITAVTEYELGLAAIALGALVGVGAARGGRGQSAQIVGAVTASVSFFVAKVFTVIFIVIFNPELAEADAVDDVSGVEMGAVETDVAGVAPPSRGDTPVVAGAPDDGDSMQADAPLGEDDTGLLAALFEMFMFLVQDTFSSMSALFLGIAVWEGYRIPRRQ